MNLRNNVIYEVTPEDWRELVRYADLFPYFIFRGQISYKWSLSTTIERLALQYGKQGMLENRELWILTEFRRRAHNLIDNPPKNDDLIEWLSLIQHHGGPTRLLDFTKSLLIGLFFACDGATEDAALWLVNYYDLLDSHAPIAENKTLYHQQATILEKATKMVGKENEESGIIPIEPERLSERMSIQQGLSIMPININQSFMDNLTAQYGWNSLRYEQMSFSDFLDKDIYSPIEEKPCVAKFLIREPCFGEILNYLDHININTNTLLPGLDGFARSLRIMLML